MQVAIEQQRTIFIQGFFEHLYSIDYSLLKSTNQSISQIPIRSDIDLLVRKEDLASLLKWMVEQPNIEKYAIHRYHAVTYVYLFFKDGGFLQVDLLTELIRKSICYLDREELLEQAHPNKEGVLVLPDRRILEHLVLFNFLNFAGLPLKYQKYFQQKSEAHQKGLIDYINGRYQTYFYSIEQLGEYDYFSHQQILKTLLNRKSNSLLGRFWRFLLVTIDFIKSIYYNRGIMITFSGVDGAGKSTIIKNLVEVLSKKYRRKVVVLRHRPSLLPILSAWRYGKAEAERRSVDRLPRQGENTNRLWSLFRFGYYFLDYIIGQLYIRIAYLWRGYVVIYDRYYFDFIIDSKRSNLALKPWIPQSLYRFIYKANINCFLYANPSIIRSRKKELPITEIEDLTKNYQQLFEDLAQRKGAKQHYFSIENLSIDDTITQILKHYKAVL